MKISNRRTIIIFAICIMFMIILAVLIPILYKNRDTNHPSVIINNPKPAAIVSGIVNISATAEDDRTPSEKISYEIYVDNQIVSESNYYSWDTTTFDEGAHTIVVKAYDKQKNFGERSVTVIVDNIVYPAPNDYFKIMTYNIKESGILPEWKDVFEEENPDICVFVETGDWDNAGNKSLYDALNEFNDYFLEEAPYTGYTAQNIQYSTSGEAIFSRYPILDFKQIGELSLDNGETYYPTHDFIDALVNISGIETHIIGAHLKCCEGDFNEQRREYEQEGIINYMDELGNVPIIYTGDLNSHSPDDVGTLAAEVDLGVGPMTMLLYPNDTIYGQYASKVHNFTDVFRTLNPTDPGYSFGPRNPSSIGRIDYIIVNQYFANNLVNSTTGDTPSATEGSDHFTVDAFIAFNFTDTYCFRNAKDLMLDKQSELNSINQTKFYSNDNLFILRMNIQITTLKKFGRRFL
ncbi:MAG: endonuclease/exonuclease/phosphatase family protein [Candidatus Heimdallarchaeaceae archaeon]